MSVCKNIYMCGRAVRTAVETVLIYYWIHSAVYTDETVYCTGSVHRVLKYVVHWSQPTSKRLKYLESWPSTTSAWAGWSRFDIPVGRYGGVHFLLICTSCILGSPTCHQDNTYWAKYQNADRASTLCTTLWSTCSGVASSPHMYI